MDFRVYIIIEDIETSSGLFGITQAFHLHEINLMCYLELQNQERSYLTWFIVDMYFSSVLLKLIFKLFCITQLIMFKLIKI